MSGLAGIVSRVQPFDADGVRAQVQAMGQAQKHREPDGCQVVTRGAVVFAAGSGTETDASASGLVLAFDGKLTNAGALRESLRKAGAAPRGESERELVLSAWETWGERSLEQIQGRFAFVLHDPRSRATWLVRDRFGHKPFYYTLRDDRIYFASEIKTLLAVLPPPGPEDLAVLEWALYGDVLPPRTLFRGIETLPVGHLREVPAQGFVHASRAYYDLAKVVDRDRYAEYSSRTPAELIDLYDATLDRVIGNQVQGRRDDVGVLLSGGVDSTIIAAQARKHVPLRSYNFSAWRNSAKDESLMARRVAEKFGLPFHSIYFDGDTYRRELARAIWHFETPLWHIQGVPTHLLARRAFADGIRILLAGVCLGPLSGAVAQDRYRWILPRRFVSRFPAGAMRVARKVIYAANGLPIANPFFVHNLTTGVRMVDGGKRAQLVERFEDAYGFLDKDFDRRVQVMRMTDNALFWPRFFRQGDSLCMAESVEFCDAAIDSDYMAVTLNLPVDVIFRKKVPKWILKELALRYVPREVSYQAKHEVWSVPIEQFFVPMFRESLYRGGFLETHLGMDWEAVNDIFRQQPEKAQVLYRLVNIEIWGRLFFLRQSVDDVSAMLQQQQ